MVLGREANMQIEKQVCSLELSKELKECGYKQEGLWLWVENSKDGTIRLWFQEAAEIEFNSYKNASFSKWKKQNTTMFDTCRVYFAPTVAELGERLPKWIKPFDLMCLEITHSDSPVMHINTWYVSYVCPNNKKKPIDIEDKSLANALAQMYIYLQKEGLI